MTDALLVALYLLPLAIVMTIYLARRRQRDRIGAARWQEAVASGLTEPASLHSVVNRSICLGSGACVRACPEGALGIIRGKAHLVNPSLCIGHGACAKACPAEAITLVWGTLRRGIDIPYVEPTFETNVRGIYIAGELGGMGLIRKACDQGRQAIESIVKSRRSGDALDVVIVGAGPAGIAATLTAMHHKLDFLTVEQEPSLGGTVYHYPRHKVVMTEPVRLPLAGAVRLERATKEELLGTWQRIIDRHAVPIRFGERLEGIAPMERGFRVCTSRGEYRARAVLLAIGRRGTPRQLGVDGESLSKVVYRLVDAEQYDGRRVLVVGGGDAAIEAAVQLAALPDARVTLAHRGDVLNRIKARNRERLVEAERSGRLSTLLRTQVVRIAEREVQLDQGGHPISLDNDVVIVCAGGVLPTPMLKELGIRVETKYGTA
jgi:thioredoxin reductase/NAD-dependent dihydropyrimidine dehydrogenase PreA subunit